MSPITAFLLGIVQGITEFLPISSSGHLVIAQNLLGWREPAVFFDIILHIGTFAAVLIVFRKDVVGLIQGAFRFCLTRPLGGKRGGLDLQEKMFLLVVVGTVPAVLVGLFARHFLEDLFASVAAVSINLLITGSFLWLTRYATQSHPIPLALTKHSHALCIGIAQSLALAPGISRSGATISAALFLGFDRDWAGRFSFLLFIPAVLGALLLEIFRLEAVNLEPFPLLVGFFTAAVSGYFALRFLLRLVRKGDFYLFAPYCWVVGIACMVWVFTGHVG